MDLLQIITEKTRQYNKMIKDGEIPDKYSQGFVDALMLAKPYIEAKTKRVVVYKDRIVEKTKTEYKTIAIQRPILKVINQYCSRNTNKEYCFSIQELEGISNKGETFIFIPKRNWHLYLFSKGNKMGNNTTKHGNTPITLKQLQEYCDYIKQTRVALININLYNTKKLYT